MEQPSNQDLLSNLLDLNKQILVENKYIRASIDEIKNISKNLLEENSKLNKKLEEVNKKLEEENIKSKEENRKLLSHFTEEFLHLKTRVDSAVKCAQNASYRYGFPRISSAEEIMEFDNKIKNNEETKNQLIKHFKTQPHDDVRKFVWENLRILFKNDEISSQFSWLSANKNIPVKDMHFINLLKDVTEEEIPSTATSTVEQHIRTFFNAVKDRINKRNKRKGDPLK